MGRNIVAKPSYMASLGAPGANLPPDARRIWLAFYAETLEFRNKLRRWRFANYSLIKPDESQLLALAPRAAQNGTQLWTVSQDEGSGPAD
jgi:hypothetical protein